MSTKISGMRADPKRGFDTEIRFMHVDLDVKLPENLHSFYHQFLSQVLTEKRLTDFPIRWVKRSNCFSVDTGVNRSAENITVYLVADNLTNQELYAMIETNPCGFREKKVST